MPVRKIKKNYRSVTGMFYSVKNKRHIAYESLLERDFYLLLEFDNTVIEYEEQPVALHYKYGNKMIRYTPDCIVHYRDNIRFPCIYEIKYSDEIKDKKVFLKQKFDQIEQYLFENDMEFVIFTELDIRTQFLENAKFVYRFANLDPDVAIFGKIQSVIKEHGSISVSLLLTHISTNKYEHARYIPYLWNMVFQGTLLTDMNISVSTDSILRLANGNT